MSELTDALTETAERLFGEHCTRAVLDATEAGSFPQALWDAMEETGISTAALPEAEGGAGLALDDVMALVRVAGRHAVPAPIGETLLAQHLLAEAGLVAPSGPLTIGPVLQGDQPRFANGRLSGRLRRIPWARHAQGMVVVADGHVVLTGRPVVAEQAANHAGEPRDTVLLDDMPVLASAPCAVALRPLGALLRANAMSGALSRALALTLRYAQDRVQFGRPISKFQAVQHHCAVLASQEAAARVAAQAASAAAAHGPAPFEIACAKLRVGEAASQGAALAHQVHGAMGFTQEHSLHFATRRIWSWRDEFGNEPEWAAYIGRIARAAGGDGMWDLLTASQKTLP